MLMKEFEKMVKDRIRAANQTEFMPFKFKKYPMIIFDSINENFLTFFRLAIDL